MKKRISDAAKELYLESGIQGFSMRKVADRVGVSAPAIYRHYENKGALLNEIVIEGLHVLESYLRPALEADTPYERLVELTEGFLKFALEQPQYFDFAFLVPSEDIELFAEELNRPSCETFRMSAEQIAACMDEGIFTRDDPLETAITIWAAVYGLISLYRTGRFGPNADDFETTYRHAVRRTLKGLMA